MGEKQHVMNILDQKILGNINVTSTFEIKCCEDTRPNNQLHATKVQHKDICIALKEKSLPSTPSSWVWVAPSTTLAFWSL